MEKYIDSVRMVTVSEWKGGEAVALSGCSGGGLFDDSRLILGVNLGAPHPFLYDNGARECFADRRLSTGEIQWTPPNIKHLVRWKDADFLLLLLDWQRVQDSLELDGKTASLFKEPRTLFRFPFAHTVLKEISREVRYSQDTTYVESLQLCLLHALVANETRADIPRDACRGLSRLDPRWKRMTEYIHANIDSRIDLTTLAQCVGLSKFHLCREYKRLHGETVAGTVTRIRLERAAEQLRYGNKTVAEIAESVGFSSHSHMCNCFRKMFDCTPFEFRSGFYGEPSRNAVEGSTTTETKTDH